MLATAHCENDMIVHLQAHSGRSPCHISYHPHMHVSTLTLTTANPSVQANVIRIILYAMYSVSVQVSLHPEQQSHFQLVYSGLEANRYLENRTFPLEQFEVETHERVDPLDNFPQCNTQVTFEHAHLTSLYIASCIMD